MQVFHTIHPAFKKLLVCFEELPKLIPAFSVIICDEKKPIVLVCAYHDAGIVFLHGLYRSKFSAVRDTAKAIRFAEKYLYESLKDNYSILCFTEKSWLKKMLEKKNFKGENITLYSAQRQ